MNIFKQRKDNKRDILTSGSKRSIIKEDSELWVFGLWKLLCEQLRTISRVFTGKLRSFTSTSRLNGKEKIMNVLKVLVASAIIAILAACGGGGGGSAPAAVVVVPPVVPVAAFACWNGTTAANKDACPVVTAPAVTLNAVSNPVITFATGATSTGGTLTGTAGATTLIYVVQPSGSVLQTSGSKAYLTMYTYNLTVNYSNGPSQTIAGTYTTGASPIVAAAVGVKLFVPKVIPFETGTTVNPVISGPTWNTADTSGIIQSYDTGIILTGSASVLPKALVGKFFIEPQGGNVCITLVYKDTNTSIYSDPHIYGGCKSTAFDWVVGTIDGYIRHYTATGVCEKETWDISVVPPTFKVTNVTCP